MNGSARRDGPFTSGWTTYFRTFVLRGVSDMVSTGRIFIHRLNRQCGEGGGGFPSCGLTASCAMSGLTVSIHLVYPTLIAQYIVFEILTEARAGWTGQPGELARLLSSELRTAAHLFWGGFRHGKYWQNLHTQGQPPVWGGFCHVGLQCQGLQSVCIWFTLAEYHSTYCLKY